MKKSTNGGLTMKRARWLLPLLIWTVVACDNDVEFNPVAPTVPILPTFPNVTTAGPGRSLEIIGSLTAEQGSCFEATVLFDGEELAGARSRCPQGSDCAKVELNADARSTSGNHTISFQVLSQSPETVNYLAKGRVMVYRDGIPMVMPLYLQPKRARLRPGESVTFEFDFLNFVDK